VLEVQAKAWAAWAFSIRKDLAFRLAWVPVLKHGPRSLTCVRVIEFSKLKGAVKAKGT